MSEYILTYSKTKFYPMNPNKEDVRIEDIAHSLSLLCRANGHYSEFYSVGAHCLNCYDEAVARGLDKNVQLCCLLHDATEAYMSDVTRPVKQFLPEYIEAEEKLANVIYEKFLGRPINDYEKQMVKMIDDALLYHEFYEFTAVKLSDEEPFIQATPDFFKGTNKQVEKAYLEAYNCILTSEEEVYEKETIKWNRK